MKNRNDLHVLSLFLVFALVVTTGLFAFTPHLQAQEDVDVTATVPSVCGNDIAEFDEDCDGNDLGGATCDSQGFGGGGTLSCTPSCTFNTSACIDTQNQGSGGTPVAPDTIVYISGLSYPDRPIALLQDGQFIHTSQSTINGDFSFSIKVHSAGTYTFSLFAEDYTGQESILYSIPVYASPNVTTSITKVYLPPTITTDKKELLQGTPLLISGQTTSHGPTTITLQSESITETLSTVAGQNGIYHYQLDTSSLPLGDYELRAETVIGNTSTPRSKRIQFSIGDDIVDREEPDKDILKGDLNIDGHVNLIDFSIAIFWYEKSLSPAFQIREQERLNGDGIVNLTDISIISYYWTG